MFIFVYFALIILLLNICMTDIIMDKYVCRSHNTALLSSFIINYQMFTITWFTWRVRLIEQELYALPESIFCVVLCGPLFICVLVPLHVMCVELLLLEHLWYRQEVFKDTTGVIRIRKSKKNRQHNGQKKKKRQKDKQRSTKHTYKT